MSVNTAVTTNGAKYNKLKRPDDFLEVTASANEGAKPDIAHTIAPKRSLDDADLSDDDDFDEVEEQNKRPRLQNVREGRKKGFRPPVGENGMQSMFPGMIDDGNISDDSTNEALAYLRSVRSEASTIPTLLVAPPAAPTEEEDRAMYDTIHGDHRVIYEEGTWIARDPDYLVEATSDDSEDLDPQEQYYINLLRRYQIMRKTMDRTAKAPPSSSTKKPNSKRIASTIPKNRHAWLYVLDREYPTPTLVSGMKEEDVLAGLKYCAHSLDRFESITKQKSCWIWALLAKAPEAGTMDYLKIGCIRDLGHKAGQFGLRLRSADEKPASKSAEDDGEDVEMRAPEEEGEVEEGEVNEEDVAEEGKTVEDEEAYEPPESTTPALVEAQANGDAHQDAPADSEAEMSISSEEEGEEREDTKVVSNKPAVNTSTNATQEKSANDGPASLEDARARLLAQLGDRLIQTPTSTARTNPRQHFTSRAAAELHRDSGGSEPSLSGPAKDVVTEIDIPDLNTRVTIDMVLTVVSECYGQRDLLRFREVWETL